MRTSKRRRPIFRPTMIEARLEERVVMSGGGPRAGVEVAASTGNLSVRELRGAFRDQFREALRTLRREIRLSVDEFFADPQRNLNTLTDLNAQIEGAINATAFRLSAQDALLPNSESQLLPRMQRALLGNGPRSLVSQVRSLLDSEVRSGTLARGQQEFTTLLDRSFSGEFRRLNNFFDTRRIRELSTNAAGQAIPLRQFLGDRLRTQLGNSLGSFAQGVNRLAATTLFPNGAITTTAEELLAFQPQIVSALGTSAFQLGSGLALFDELNPNIQTDFQNSFFGSAPTFDSIFNGIPSLPTDSGLFPESMSRLVSNAFSGSLETFNEDFGLQPIIDALPTGSIPGLFTPGVAGFGFGFNDGFGTGFVGLGQPRPGQGSLFNPSMGAGFANIVSGTNPTFGFNVPTFSDGDGTDTDTPAV